MLTVPTRRALMASVLGLALGAPAPALGGDDLTAEVDLAGRGQATDAGRRDRAAAWIACVATVFASYGHRVPQPRIVAEAYGSLAAIPSVVDAATARRLDRMWTDMQGTAVRMAVELLYDASVAAATPDLVAFVEALRNADPLVLVGGDHPVVLAGLRLGGKGTPTIQGGRVFDPYPDVGVRPLDPAELIAPRGGGRLHLAVRLTFPGLG